MTARATEAHPVAPAAPPDLRMLPPAAATWLAALAAVYWRAPLVVATCTVGLLLALASVPLLGRVGRDRGLAWVAVGAAACAVASSAAVGARMQALHSGPVAALAADRAVVRADMVLSTDPAPVRPRVRGNARAPAEVVLTARLERVDARGRSWRVRTPVLLVAPATGWRGLLPGQRVSVSGRLRATDPVDDVAAVLTARGPPELLGRPSLLQRAAGHVRERLRSATAGLPSSTAGVLTGLVDGDTSRLPATTAEEFRVAGMSHLMAVSGANVAFVLAAVLVAARWVGLRAYALPVAGVVGLGGFLVLARPEPSVLRATVMALVGIAATARGGSGRRGPPALASSVVVLLLADPFLARSPGFALSVLATAGLLVLAPGWQRRLERRRFPRPLAAAVAVAAAAQVTTVPVLVLLAPQVGLMTVPANVLAEPAVPVATVLGVVVALVGVVSPMLASALAQLGRLPAGWIVAVAHAAAGAPFAAVPWPAGPGGALLLVPALLGLRLVLPWLVRRPVVPAVGLVGVLMLSWSPVRRHGWPPPGWLVVACDVGQGDALVVGLGAGTALVVDTGPDPAPVDRCLRDLGVDRVPLLLLTHFHADHVEGVPGVLQGRTVGAVEVSPWPDPPDEARRVVRWAAAGRIPIVVAAPGEQRAYAGVSWTVLWPRRRIDSGSVPNNASVVLRLLTHGVTVLLTGDVEPEAQGAILAADPSLVPADVLKVPHHGSANQDPAFLRAVGARFALVSVGADNPYGHPAPSTLDLLTALGETVGRTDLDGDLAVVGGPGSIRLVARHPP